MWKHATMFLIFKSIYVKKLKFGSDNSRLMKKVQMASLKKNIQLSEVLIKIIFLPWAWGQIIFRLQFFYSQILIAININSKLTVVLCFTICGVPCMWISNWCFNNYRSNEIPNSENIKLHTTKAKQCQGWMLDTHFLFQSFDFFFLFNLVHKLSESTMAFWRQSGNTAT